MRLCVVITAVCLCVVGLSVADDVHASIRKQTNIPAEGLGPALQTLAKERNFQIVYVSEEVNALHTQGAIGEFTPEEALKQLLKGTGLTYRFFGENAISIIPVTSASPPSTSAVDTQPSPRSNEKNNEKEEAKSNSFRLAQANQGVAQVSSTVGSDVRSSGSENSPQLTEILVTAQKKTERLQDVPVPVSVLDTQALTENNQVLLRDLNGAVPGLAVTPSIENTQGLTIRGLSTGVYGTQTVAITVDDVPTVDVVIPDFDPGDLARIEVLRGPQGTLYGSDSIGGLVNYVTADPSVRALSGQVQVGGSTVSNGAELGYNVRGSVNVPLSDTLAIRASAFTREDPGYIDDVLTGQNGVNKTKVYGGRLAALWSPSNVISLKLSALYQHMDGGEPLAYVPTPGFQNTAGLGSLQQNEFAGGGDFTREFQIYSAVLKARIGSVDLVSLTGYGVTKALYLFDFSYLFGPFYKSFLHLNYQPGGAISGYNDTSRFTQEIRASSQIGSNIDWLMGAFYSHEINPGAKTIVENAVTPATGQFIANGLFLYSPSALAEYAAFADLTLHFTERFDVQVGGRESWDKTIGEQSETIDPLFGAPEPSFATAASGTVSAATYLVTPRFKISQDLMLYARAASGYQPGRPNSTYGLSPDIPRDYGPATSWTYEVGFKGEVVDHKLSIDASIYYIDWRNIQLGLASGPFGYTGNGGAAKSEGVELALESRPLAGLKLSGWITYDNAVLTKEFPSSASTYGAAGERLPNASRFSGNLSLEQEFPLGSELTGLVGGAVSYVGDSLGVFTGTPGVPAPRSAYPGYTKIDLHAGVSYASWKVYLFGTNLADRRAVIDGGYGEYPPFARQYITPRTVGLNLVKTF